MYLGHNLKQQDQEKQQAYQEEQRQRELDTKLVLAGYKPVTPEQQMGDVGNGPPAANQVSIKGLGNYIKPSEDPKVFTAGGATFVADKEGKLTQVKTPGSDKLPSAELQAFAEWKKVNPEGTYEKFAPWYANLKEKSPTPSFGLSVGPDGSIQVTAGEGASGMAGGVPLTPAARNKAQTDVFDIDLSLQNLKNVASLYKPEFQQMPTKWQNAISAGKEKWLGQNLDQNERQSLVEYTNYRKSAVGMYSEEIAKGGGKTLTPFEVKIYGGKLPNPGTGMFDGDSPTEFESGMKQMYSTLMKSKARMMWYQTIGQGAEFNKKIKSNQPADKAGLISLEDMDKVINNRAAQLERDMRIANPGITPPQLSEMVKNTIQKEFFGESKQ
jgi:hypothetical protein